MITEVRWNLWLVTARVAETAPTQGAQSSGNSNWFLGDEEFHNLTGNMKNWFLVGCVTGIPSKIALIIRKKTSPEDGDALHGFSMLWTWKVPEFLVTGFEDALKKIWKSWVRTLENVGNTGFHVWFFQDRLFPSQKRPTYIIHAKSYDRGCYCFARQLVVEL